MNGDGLVIQKDESKYVWLSHIALQNAGNTSDINCASLSPRVCVPLSTVCLKPLLIVMKKCFKHNFVPAVMALASSVMCLHYETILELYEGCPVPYLYGVSQTGKSQACKAALALVGMQKKGFYKKNTSQKWFLDRCSLSSMPFVIDDPRDLKDRRGSSTVPAELLDLANDIFDGGIVANLRTGAIWPRITCIITANALPASDKYECIVYMWLVHLTLILSTQSFVELSTMCLVTVKFSLRNCTRERAGYFFPGGGGVYS